jgi:phosphatidylglycerol---prolipoprotein diacylglyceryl transferase
MEDSRTGMWLFAIPYPNIDPVAFSLGPLTVKWYGLAYMAGLILGWFYIRRLLSETRLWAGGGAPFPPAKADDLLLYMTVGVVLGGRLGYVLLYQPSYYLSDPLAIFAVWRGGMAFHGALLGCGLAIWAFAARNQYNPWSSMDLCAAAVPLGLFFGRIANFINGELWGRPTSMPWGMVFPGVEAYLTEPTSEPRQALGWDPLAPRHPSQLYEAALEGLVLFIVLRVLTHRLGGLKSPGLVTGVFLIGYGLARSTGELFRQPDPFHPLTAHGLTPGIVYSIPMILLGAWFVFAARRRHRASS